MREVKKERMRKFIGMVKKDKVILKEKIEYNIRYGRKDEREEDVEKEEEIEKIEGLIKNMKDG